MRGPASNRPRLAVLALLLVFCLVSLIPSAFAASDQPVLLGHRVTEDALLLYVKGVSADTAVQVQIGQDLADGVSIADGSQIPIVTWIVVDNTASLPEMDQEKVLELAAELVAGRAHDERFRLATADETLHVLSAETDSYNDLKTLIGEITFEDRNAYLYDVLDEVLRMEQTRTDPVYVRIVVLSDGGEDNPSGLTDEEVQSAFSSAGIPVYVMGCEIEGQEQAMKHLNALSRVSGGANWSLTQTENVLDIVQVLSGEELPVCITIPIPAALQDGSVKGVQVTLDGSSTITLQANMPFGTPQGPAETEPQAEATLEPTPATTLAPTVQPTEELEATEMPKPTEEPTVVQAPEISKKNPLPIFIGAFVAVFVVLAVVLLLLRKKHTAGPEPAPIVPPPPTAGKVEETAVVPNSISNLEDGGTSPIGSSARRYMLQLADVDHPEHKYEVPLIGRVTIGRSSSNQVVLDYEPTVSGKHCEIYQEGNAFWICDLGSRNHTYVDGERVENTAEILSGSEINLGRARLRVEIR